MAYRMGKYQINMVYFLDDVKVGWGTIIDGEPKQWGKDLVDNFIAGIKEKMAELEKSLEDFGGMVYDYLHHSEPEKGKLADDEKWGSDFAQNFIDGITEKSSALQQAVENMAGNISGAFEIGVNFASENTDKIGAFISDAINNIETLNLSQIGSNIEDVLSNARIESGVNTSEYDYSTVYNEKREESNENSAVNVFGGVNITIQGENKNPQQIAEEIAEELQKLTNMQSMIGGKTAWDR